MKQIVANCNLRERNAKKQGELQASHCESQQTAARCEKPGRNAIQPVGLHSAVTGSHSAVNFCIPP